jgi:hypothetical protein
MLMGGAVGMDVKLAAMFRLGAVIVNADMAFCQAMRDGGIVGKRKGDRRRENAKHVERGKGGRRFGAKSFGEDRQHLASCEHSIEELRLPKDRILTPFCNFLRQLYGH